MIKPCLNSLIDFSGKMTGFVYKERAAWCLLLRILHVFLAPQHKTLINWHNSSGCPPRRWVAWALAQAEGAEIVQLGERTASRELKSSFSTSTRKLSRRLSWFLHSVGRLRDHRCIQTGEVQHETGRNLPCEGSQVLQQAAWSIHAISSLGGFQDLSGKSPELTDLTSELPVLWAGVLFQRDHSFWSCEFSRPLQENDFHTETQCRILKQPGFLWRTVIEESQLKYISRHWSVRNRS